MCTIRYTKPYYFSIEKTSGNLQKTSQISCLVIKSLEDSLK